MNTDYFENLLSEILERAEFGLSTGRSPNPYQMHDLADALTQIKAMVERHQQYSFQERFDSMVDTPYWKDELDV